MKASALEVNLENPRVRARLANIAKLRVVNDGGKLTARDISDDETLSPGRLSGYDLRVFLIDEPEIPYAVFSFETPIAWVIEDSSGEEVRFITSAPITTTTERHRDVVRLAWARTGSTQSFLS